MADQTNVSGEQRAYSPAATIATRTVRLYAQYLGRGPTKARTTLNTNVVLVMFGQTMTRAEHNLVAAGEAEAVRWMRRKLERSMREEAVAIVEEVTRRKVTAYMSDLDPDANTAVLVFALDPRLKPARLRWRKHTRHSAIRVTPHPPLNGIVCESGGRRLDDRRAR